MDDEATRGWSTRHTLAMVAALVLLLLAEISDVIGGEIPIDFEVYHRAATAFFGGHNPYARLDDKLTYLYVPGTLYLFAPLSWASAATAAAGFLALQWLALCGALAALLRLAIVRLPFGVCLGISLMYYPVMRNIEAGNLNFFMLAALVACMAASLRARRIGLLLGAAAAAAVLTIKPHWLLLATLVALVQRRADVIAAMGLGVGLIAALSVPHLDLFLEAVRAARADVVRVQMSDPWDLSTVAGVAVTLVWFAVLLTWWRSRRPMLALFATTAMVCWPRLLPYAYVALLPALLVLLPRLPRKQAVALCVPLCWIPVVGAQMIESGEMSLQLGWSTVHAVFAAIHYLLAWLIIALLYRECRPDEAQG